MQRRVLLAPSGVARAAARASGDRRARWMLSQPLRVRRSFVRDVLDGDGSLVVDRRREIWMLRQPQAVRESYVRDVLEEGG